MSNNYNTTLQNNNALLQDALEVLQALPKYTEVTPQADPTISINTSTGVVTATVEQEGGFLEGGTKTATKQIEDPNLVPANILKGKTILGVAGTADGDTSREDGIVSGTFSGAYENNRVTKIKSYAFGSCASITQVTFANATSIGDAAFQRCTKLVSASFPKATTMGQLVFAYDTALTTLYLPICTVIGVSGTRGATALKSISLPKCTTLSSFAFRGNTAMSSFSLPLCATIGASAFQSCAMTSISLPVCKTIATGAFSSCTKLTAIYLPSTIMCTLNASDAFTGAGIKSTAGSIFVPASLVSSYKAATNWTYFSNRIFAIS